METMDINFRTWAPQSRGFFVMAQLTDGSAPRFSCICDRASARMLFGAAISNPRIGGASLIERDSQGEHELAAYAHAGLAETPGTPSGWRMALDAASELQERHEAAREARKAAMDPARDANGATPAEAAYADYHRRATSR